MHSKIFFQFFNRKDQSERDSLRDIVTTLARLRELGKPFVVIMSCSTLTTRSKHPGDRASAADPVQEDGGRRGGAERAVACIFVGDSGCRGTWCS